MSMPDLNLRAVWRQMKSRCENPSNEHYPWYGDRGIKVCDEWQDYEVFAYWATGSGYKRGLQIDRQDNNGNYKPQNCRWITSAANSRNRSDNRHVIIQDETKILADWVADPRCQVTRRTFYLRIRAGWPEERALLEPRAKSGLKGRGSKSVEAFGESKTLLDWSADSRCRVPYDTLKWRLLKGASPEEAISKPSAWSRQ